MSKIWPENENGKTPVKVLIFPAAIKKIRNQNEL